MRLGFLGRGDAMTEVAARGPTRGHSGAHPGSTTPSNSDFHMIRAPSSPHLGGGGGIHNSRPVNPSGFPHPPAGASPSRMGPQHPGPQGMGAHSSGILPPFRKKSGLTLIVFW
jgi:hypothetical protein